MLFSDKRPDMVLWGSEGNANCLIDVITSDPTMPNVCPRGAIQTGAAAEVAALHKERAWTAQSEVKSSQGLLFSVAKKPYAEAVGQTGAQGLERGCGPHCPPVSRKNPARDEASGAPPARGGAAQASLGL